MPRNSVVAFDAESYIRTASPIDMRRLLGVPRVDVWAADLDAFDSAVFGPLLSRDEMERAARFHFDRDRDRYITCRGILRVLLASYLERTPGSLSFSYGREGKPSLALDAALHFNVAHSEARALLAFTSRGEVGVDIEAVRDVPELDLLATNYFSAREVLAFRSLAPADRTAGFYRCWTRKEAFIKALGDGLAHPLDAFAVSFDRDRPATLDWVRGHDSEPGEWSLRELDRLDFVGAVALRSPSVQVRCGLVSVPTRAGGKPEVPPI